MLTAMPFSRPFSSQFEEVDELQRNDAYRLYKRREIRYFSNWEAVTDQAQLALEIENESCG